MKGNHRIWEDGTEYKVELPSLYRYIWKNRKAFNSMLKNECRFLVTKFEIGRKVSVYENITGHRYHGTISKITTQHLWIKVNDNCTLKFHWDDDICITRRLED